MEIQLRNDEGDIWTVPTVADAFAEGDKDPTIWKISFGVPSGERVRLIRGVIDDNGTPKQCWVYEDLVTAVKESMNNTSD